MDEKKQTWKAAKKAYKKAKRKALQPWKGIAIAFLVLALIMTPLAVVADMFDNAVAAIFGGTFWKVEGEDPTAIYFEEDFASDEERLQAGADICYQVEAEGAVLLMNNGALPLAAGSKVSTLSTSSVNIVYGGTGSGNVDASKADSLKTALEKSGFEVNATLWDFYTTGEGAKYSRNAGAGETSALMGSFNIGEAPWSVYTQEVKDSIATYGDAVIITLSRIGGEGSDAKGANPADTNYLALDQNERDMMAAAAQLKAEGKVKSIVVLINTSNALQVDFLKDNEYAVDACLWIGGVGAYGTNAVTDILAGKVNPSGSLVDTYCYDNFSSPAMKNAVPVTYGGYDGKNIPDYAETYLIYQEGIYVGYKYYETRYEDVVMGTGNAGSFDYDAVVAFPFGHGLSYTTFEYSDMNVSYDAAADTFTVTVKVTNIGAVAGKETVQIYAQSPYTDYDKENGVEKAAVQLCGFGKTAILEPGASETVTVTVEKRELASFDTYGAGTYILDAGDYYLTVGTDAHNAVNNILAAKGYAVEAENELTYKWTEETLDTTTYATSANGTAIENQLSLGDPNLYEGTAGQSVTWLSRQDWAGTYPSDEQIVLKLTDLLIKDLQRCRYLSNPDDYGTVQMPTMGADNGLSLIELMGADYDDPRWEQLLDQLTYEEMCDLIGDSFHWRMPAESVNAPGSRDENGPQGLTVALFGSTLGVETTAFTSEDVMAATFNVELMYQVGNIIGNDCLAADVACLYGPGANMHRMPYGGRNFEYYSEDGFLSGAICAAEVLGIQEKGVDVVIKHFALNDSEQDRIGLGVWLNEQAAREIYLKAYQAAFEKSGANGVMTAYTRWGAVWSGGNKGLMTNILRKEWGNNGMSITDNVITPMVTGADGVLAGVTTYDAMLPNINNELPGFENDAVIVSAMREACHHNLYALVNSSAMNGIGKDTTVKRIAPDVVILAAVMAGGFCVATVGFGAVWVLKARAFAKSEEYAAFKAAKKARK